MQTGGYDGTKIAQFYCENRDYNLTYIQQKLKSQIFISNLYFIYIYILYNESMTNISNYSLTNEL